MGLIANALNEYAVSSNRTWATDRSQTVGASEVGQCARKVYWLKNEDDPVHGVARDPEYVDGWGARMRGTVFENAFWEPALRAKYGERLRYAGAEQQTFIKGFLSATPDGLLIDMEPDAVAPGSGSEITVECKTADPRTNLSEAKPENVYQTHVQMGLMRDLTVYKPTHSVLSYTDASFWNEGREFVIAFDPKVYEAAQARAAKIMTATSAADLRPEGWVAGGRECEYCPFTKACGIQRRSVTEQATPADPQFIAELSDLARQLKRYEAVGKTADTNARDIQDQIKSRLQAKGLRRIVGFGTSITWSSVKGRPSWDNKRLREAAANAGVPISQFETTGEPTDRLVVTVQPLSDDQSETTQAVA